jgi:acetyl esterase/lipase
MLFGMRRLSRILFVILASTSLTVHPAFASPPVLDSSYQNLVYANVDGTALKLDLYLPPASTTPAPLLIWIHGGSWEWGNKDFPFAPFFTNAGFALASIDYRLTGQAPFPAQIHDCKAAVRWLRFHAAEYNIDPNRIIAMGASAGGHLAALLGITPDDPRYEGNEGVTGVSSRVQGVCDFCGPTDLLSIRGQYLHLPTFAGPNALDLLLGGTVAEKMALARLASPALQVTNRACPFFIAHGNEDRMVPVKQSEELDAALTKVGVPVTLRIVNGAGHNLTDPTVYAEALAFVNRLLHLS